MEGFDGGGTDGPVEDVGPIVAEEVAPRLELESNDGAVGEMGGGEMDAVDDYADEQDHMRRREFPPMVVYGGASAVLAAQAAFLSPTRGLRGEQELFFIFFFFVAFLMGIWLLFLHVAFAGNVPRRRRPAKP